MDEVVLVFPHQLYDHHPALSKERSIFIVEDLLFFQGPKRQIKHRETLAKNPRMRLTVANLDHMDERLRREHLAVAEEFLHKLS